MSSNLYKVQESNVWKTWSLMAGFLIIIMLIGWAFSIYYGMPEILYVFLAFSILMNFVSYWSSDKIVLKISGAKRAKKEEYYDLYTITENLSIAAGLPMPKLYVIHDASPNAFATGRNKNHAAVAVTTGLLDILEKNELEGVIAHELAHIQNKDILLQSVVVVLVGLIVLASDAFLRMSLFGRGDRDSKAGGIIAIIGIVLMILSPLIATFIQLAISRKREFMADASGALLTRYPEGLANALKKISNHPVAMRKANHATAHMYISDPFKEPVSKINREGKKEKIGFFHRMFLTHPPVNERVDALLGKSDFGKDDQTGEI
jgi:heat shock protein HtpX